MFEEKEKEIVFFLWMSKVFGRMIIWFVEEKNILRNEFWFNCFIEMCIGKWYKFEEETRRIRNFVYEIKDLIYERYIFFSREIFKKNIFASKIFQRI